MLGSESWCRVWICVKGRSLYDVGRVMGEDMMVVVTVRDWKFSWRL